VIVASADFIGGYALWVDEKGLLAHTYSFLGVDTFKLVSTEPIPTGDVTVNMLFQSDAPKPGAGGKVTLWANDRQVGEGAVCLHRHGQGGRLRPQAARPRRRARFAPARRPPRGGGRRRRLIDSRATALPAERRAGGRSRGSSRPHSLVGVPT
jgi:hypothetical protein